MRCMVAFAGVSVDRTSRDCGGGVSVVRTRDCGEGVSVNRTRDCEMYLWIGPGTVKCVCG